MQDEKTLPALQEVTRDGFSLLRASDEGFGLSLQLITIAGIIVCGIMAALGVHLGTYVTKSEIDNAADRSAFFMEALLLPALAGVTPNSSLPVRVEVALDEIAQGLGDRSIPTVQVWWTDGTVAFSTDKAMVGRTLSSQQLARAAAGAVVAHLEEDLTPHGLDRQRIVGLPLLEVYMPLHEPRTGSVFAIGEFYIEATDLLAEVGRVKFNIWLAILVATALMLIMLGVVAVRARRVVLIHRNALRERLVEAQRLAAENADLLILADQAKVEAFAINEDLLHRIGSDLHDGPLQLLGLIMLRLEGLDAASAERPETPAQRAKTIELVSSTAEELRALSGGLTLPELDGLDLAETIRLAVARHEGNTDTSVELILDPLTSTDTTPLKICVYRIVQEGLNNAFWHAGGVGQRVEAAETGRELRLTINDSGPGMSEQQRPKSALGIAGLSRRVVAFGGTISVASGSEGGTQVTATLPLSARAPSTAA